MTAASQSEPAQSQRRTGQPFGMVSGCAMLLRRGLCMLGGGRGPMAAGGTGKKRLSQLQPVTRPHLSALRHTKAGPAALLEKPDITMTFPTTHPALARALAGRDYTVPTAVQLAVLEDTAANRDLLVSAQTGSGKTVAFGLAFATTLLGDAPLDSKAL